MPTTIVKTIGSGGDYTTLQSWEDAAPANYVTADQIWQGQIKAASDSFTSATILLTISGGTVDSTRYAELTTATGASFRDNANVQTNALRANSANGCIITCTGNYVHAVNVGQNFSRLSNLQIVQSNGGGGGNSCLVDSIGSDTATLDLNNCIFESGGSGGVISLFGSNIKVRNSLIVQRGSGEANIANIKQGTKAYNCTFAVPSDKTACTNAVTGAYGAATFTNCLFFGCSNVATGTAPTFTTCYTDDATPPSGCTTATYGNQFQVTTDATRDFRIKTGADALDTGTTDSTNAPIDIAGTARPSGSAYDVGAWELVAAAANVYNIMTGRGGAAAQPLAVNQ